MNYVAYKKLLSAPPPGFAWNKKKPRRNVTYIAPEGRNIYSTGSR